MLKLNKFFAEAKKYPCPNIKRQNRAKIQIICFLDKFMLINLIILFNILISRVFPLVFILIVHNIAHHKTYSFWDTCYINVITHVVSFFFITIFLLFIIVYCCMIKISTPNSQHLHIKIERQNDHRDPARPGRVVVKEKIQISFWEDLKNLKLLRRQISDVF